MFFARAKLLKISEDSFNFLNNLTFFALFLKNFIKFAPIMKITRLSSKEYFQTFPAPQHAFNSARFIELNSWKISEVIHLCIADSKPRLGLSIGRRDDGSLLAPFSAPFSGFDFNRRQSAETMLEAAQALRTEVPGLKLTLPPAIYAPDMNSRTLLALMAAGAKIDFSDWNFHIPLSPRPADYLETLSSDSRKKLKKALRSQFHTLKINNDPERAYRVIQANRQQHAYPLRMTLDDVIATTAGSAPIIEADFFVLTDGATDVAAAMVYNVSPGIRQVVYWGDDSSVQHLCPTPVNLLALHLVNHYGNLGNSILDIGPSSSGGILSPGLCKFKDSIGCQITPKPTLTL